MKTTINGQKLLIEVNTIIETLKPNGWGIRACFVLFSDGLVLDGFIEGDEHMVKIETLEIYCQHCQDYHAVKENSGFNLGLKLCFDCSNKYNELESKKLNILN